MDDTKKPGEDDSLKTGSEEVSRGVDTMGAQPSGQDSDDSKAYDSASAGQSEGPRRSTAAEVASGLGISALVYALLWAAFASQVGVIIIVLSLVLLGGGMVWSIRLMRSGRTALGLTMLTAFSIPLLALLTVGACALLFFPTWG